MNHGSVGGVIRSCVNSPDLVAREWFLQSTVQLKRVELNSKKAPAFCMAMMTGNGDAARYVSLRGNTMSTSSVAGYVKGSTARTTARSRMLAQNKLFERIPTNGGDADSEMKD